MGKMLRNTTFISTRSPTHAYLKSLYKYPQMEFPYAELSRSESTRKPETEFEFLDTCIFDENRYFDVFVEYAKDLS